MVLSAVRSLDDFPAAERAARLRRLADFYQELYADIKPCPEWVGMLAALAEEQASAGAPREEQARKH